VAFSYFYLLSNLLIHSSVFPVPKYGNATTSLPSTAGTCRYPHPTFPAALLA
jgi:hypothetical protein